VAGGKPNGNKFYDRCDGDPVSGLGKHSCHEQAAKINPSQSVQTFVIGLAGQRKPGPTSVVVKKGSQVKACRILGMGLEAGPSPFQAANTIERIDFEGCPVDFVRSPTGDVVSATLAPGSPGDCSSPFWDDDTKELTGMPVSQLQLKLGEQDLGSGQFGEGYVSSGTGSCTTRIVGGKVYTWGKPCP
jgi:hypothetical protein